MQNLDNSNGKNKLRWFTLWRGFSFLFTIKQSRALHQNRLKSENSAFFYADLIWTMNEMPPHIGKIIQQTLKKQDRSVTWCAKQLNYTRDNMYKIFEKEWIDTHLLTKLSLVLGVDFFKYYSEYVCNNLHLK
ncbi:MAG: hypothetical protein MJ197_05685 [Bacteroidales bacterium]|nr:hypothetical protein [Bacteroidales bacterium]